MSVNPGATLQYFARDAYNELAWNAVVPVVREGIAARCPQQCLRRDVAEPFAINLTAGAEADLHWFSAYARRIILDGLELHLRYQPTVGTRRIKVLRSNPIAGWELRLGDYRSLYDVDETHRVVTIQVVGEKQGNRLLVQGQEYTRHESHRPERSENEP